MHLLRNYVQYCTESGVKIQMEDKRRKQKTERRGGLLNINHAHHRFNFIIKLCVMHIISQLTQTQHKLNTNSTQIQHKVQHK